LEKCPVGIIFNVGGVGGVLLAWLTQGIPRTAEYQKGGYVTLIDKLTGGKKSRWNSIEKIIESGKLRLAIPQIRNYSISFKLSPEENAAAVNTLADIHFKLGEYERSCNEYSKLIKMAPANEAYQSRYCEVLLKLSEFETAEKYAAGLLKKYGPKSLYLAFGGEVKRLKKVPGAEELFKKAVEKDGKNAVAHMGLGKIYLELGRTDDAIISFEDATKVRSYRLSGLYMIGEAYYKKGNDTKAQETLEIALKSVRAETTDTIRARYILGLLYEKNKEQGRALDQYRLIVEVSPGYADVMKRLKANTRYARDRVQDYDTKGENEWKALVMRLSQVMGYEPIRGEIRSNEEVIVESEDPQSGILKKSILLAFFRGPGLKEARVNAVNEYGNKRKVSKVIIVSSGPISKVSFDTARGFGNDVKTRKDLTGILTRYEKSVGDL